MVKQPIDWLTKLKQSLLAKSNFDDGQLRVLANLSTYVQVDAPDVAVHQLDVNRASPKFESLQARGIQSIAKRIAAGFLLVPAHRRRASERGVCRMIFCFHPFAKSEYCSPSIQSRARGQKRNCNEKYFH